MFLQINLAGHLAVNPPFVVKRQPATKRELSDEKETFPQD